MADIKSCRLCNSHKINTMRKIKSPHSEFYYTLYNCENCESKFFNPEEHPLSLEELYESFANEQNKSMLNAHFKPTPHWNYQKKIIYRLLKNSPKNILDIGCRTGDFLMHFPASVQKNGVELSEQYSEICKQRGIKMYSDFVENIEFKEKYDVVSCYALLEHIVEPLPLIDKLKTLVNNKGLLIILVPWHECLKEKILYFLRIQWHMFSPPEHLNFFSKKLLVDAVTKEGNFKLIKYQYTSGGIFNPFKKVPLLGKIFNLLMRVYDRSFMNKLAIFDHIFLYYKKIN